MKTPAPLLSTNIIQADIDRNTTLCLACASSLPPLKRTIDSHSEIPPGAREIFLTQCCGRPICAKCLTSNPRLQRYNPCLSCLEGVSVVRSSTGTPVAPHTNIDGAMRDEDTFILEDEDEGSSLDDDEVGDQSPRAETFQPAYLDLSHNNDDFTLHNTAGNSSIEASAPNHPPSSKYYITQTDTLRGIALRFGLDGREICRLNNLSPSTLSTTPHLLHTRRFLILPPSALHHLGPSNIEEERVREAEIHRERAEKRLQTVTKEMDWRVAKAYVALADDAYDEAGEADEYSRKRKEAGISFEPGSRPSGLEERAIEHYLDDEEWEATHKGDESRAGLPNPPVGKGLGEGSSSSEKNDKEGDRRWWQWKF